MIRRMNKQEEISRQERAGRSRLAETGRVLAGNAGSAKKQKVHAQPIHETNEQWSVSGGLFARCACLFADVAVCTFPRGFDGCVATYQPSNRRCAEDVR